METYCEREEGKGFGTCYFCVSPEKPVPSECVCVCEQLFKESRVMLGLMLLIKPRSSEAQSGRRSWTSSQQEELQLQALAALTSLAPLMLDDYMTCQANTCLLLLLDWCLQDGTASSSSVSI